MSDDIRERIEHHWEVCDAADWDAAHEIYAEHCVVEWPQSGERVVGKANLQSLREHHPARLGFSTKRIIDAGGTWITEYVITYDGAPVYTVSIMDFEAGKVVKETHYFSDPFEPPSWRAQWVERT